MIADWDGDPLVASTDLIAELTKPMMALAAFADAMSTVADIIADGDWSTLVEGWNAVIEEEVRIRIIMPRKVKLERRREWHRRSESQCRQRIMQSRNRREMHAKKTLRRSYAAKTG